MGSRESINRFVSLFTLFLLFCFDCAIKPHPRSYFFSLLGGIELSFHWRRFRGLCKWFSCIEGVFIR